MTDPDRFEGLMERFPIPKDKMVGQAVSWFLQKQDPDSVTFTSYKNGYRVSVETGEDGVEDASEFWEEYIHPNLGDPE